MSDKEHLLTRQKQWKIFNAWEIKQILNESHDPAGLSKWYGDAWETARSLNPNWANGLDHEKILRLQKMREELSLLGESDEQFRAKP